MNEPRIDPWEALAKLRAELQDRDDPRHVVIVNDDGETESETREAWGK